MRFFAIFAAAFAVMTPVIAQGQNPKNCLQTCYVYSADAENNCRNTDHSAIYREGPGCFKCCESV